jgi:hypothetical protein
MPDLRPGYIRNLRSVLTAHIVRIPRGSRRRLAILKGQAGSLSTGRVSLSHMISGRRLRRDARWPRRLRAETKAALRAGLRPPPSARTRLTERAPAVPYRPR